MSQRFEYTGKGYVEALAWLKEVEEWKRVLTEGFSCDGWSVIHEANSIWERKSREDGNKEH